MRSCMAFCLTVATATTLALVPLASRSEEKQTRMARVAPANFRNAEIIDEFGLWWQDEAISGVLFISASEKEEEVTSFKLVPGTSAALRALLTEMGFENESARKWSQQQDFTTAVATCLPLALPLTGCAPIQLNVRQHDKRRYVELTTDDALTTEFGRVRGASLIGASQFSLGASHSRISEGRYASASTRGIIAHENITYEYDTSLSYLQVHSSAQGLDAPTTSRTQANYRLLAAGVGLQNGERAYAGTFQAAYGISGDIGSQFFSHPAIVGIAYRSQGMQLSPYGTRGKIRLLLPTESFVRILSGSVELFSGTLQAGDQTVDFQGYQESFVDVSIRDPSGMTRSLRSEVIQEASSPTPPILFAGNEGLNQGEWYADLGQIVDSSYQNSAGLKFLNSYQASVNYNQRRYGYLWGGGVQLIGNRRRLSASATPASSPWRATAMLGKAGEKGLIASISAIDLWQLDFAVNTTLYRPPSDHAPPLSETTITQNTSGPCQVSGNPICYQSTRYDSFGVNLGVKGFPIRLGYLSFRTPLYDYSQITVSGGYTFKIGEYPITAVAYLSHDPKSKFNSISVSFTLPLESRQTISSSASRQGSNSAVAVSYAWQADSLSNDTLRSINLGAAESRPSGASTSSAYAIAQFGPVNTSTSINASSDGNYGMSATFSLGYAASRAGIAFSDTGFATTPSGLFNAQSSAALALVNDSLDNQTFKIGKNIYEIKPSKTLLVSRSPGSVDKWNVAPGPAEDIRQPIRRLTRGQVALYRVVEGLWVQATFIDSALKTAIRPRHTLKAAGAEPIRLYFDSKFRSLLYETVGTESEVQRLLVDETQQIWKCLAPAPKIDLATRAAYTSIEYQCTHNNILLKQEN